MNEIIQNLIQTEHELIKEIITLYDRKAQVFLFGPGSKIKGLPMDIYINSEKINVSLRKLISTKLKDYFSVLNIDGIYPVNREHIENIKAIALEI